MSEPGGDILAEVDRLITALEAHSDPAVREQLTQLLEGIDVVHRQGLTHLMAAIHGMGGDAFVNRLTADPAIRLLLMSYDLVAVDRRLQAEEALDTVRGHLHARGIDVELSEVVGSVVYVKLHGLDASGIPVSAVRRDLEEALKAGLLGFQELELGARSAGAPGGLVPLGGLRRARRPVYQRAFDEAELPVGAMRGIEIDGQPVLIANLGGEFCAVSNRCGPSPLPLEFGRLEGAELLCSWHGCRYDVRTGARLDAEGERLAVYPVALADGEVRVAVGVEPAAEETVR